MMRIKHEINPEINLEQLTMETLADRVRQRMEELGLTEQQVVQRAGNVFSQAAFHKIKSGQTKKPRNILEISDALECNSTWLSSGKGSKHLTSGTVDMSVDEGLGVYNIEPISSGNATSRKLIPLISWVQAGSFCESHDLFSVGDAEEWYPHFKGAGLKSYALRVKGDSMTSPYPGSRSYPEGVIIFVDPEKEVLPGNRGIFKLADTNEVTFKELVSDAGKNYLKPLNPQYDKIPVDTVMTTCGRVIGSFMPE